MNVYVVLLIQILVASGTHIVAKSVTNDFEAHTLTLLRGLVSGVGSLLLMRLRNISLAIERRDFLRLSVLGVFGMLNQLLYLYGLHFTTAANAALLYGATPVCVLIISRFVLKEKMTMQKTLGIALAFSGVAIVIFERGVSFSSSTLTGNLIIFVAVILWSLFTVLGKPAVLKYGAIKATSVSGLLGTMYLLPFEVHSLARVHANALTAHDWFGVLYLGIGTSIVGYLLWYYALGRIEASKLAVFANGQPIMATVLSAVFLDFRLTETFVIGGCLTIAGVIATQVNPRGTFR
ncbi:MAG: DMT family transporter, partial [Ignavibacteriales bacterium]|nr:DMT family transporter [Ignavibacteriales bacterium]